MESTDHRLASIRDDLDKAIEALLMLRSDMTARQVGMRAAFDQQSLSLRQDVDRFRQDVEGIVAEAGARIAREARDAVSPAAAEYSRAVSETSGRLRAANRTIWTWFGAAAATLLLVLVVAWAVLGYHRRELASLRDQIQRHDDAIPVVQAFYASDAIICEGRICGNVDPDGQQVGDQGQYRPIRPRP